MAAKGWDESVRAIMLAGKALPVLAESERTDRNRIDGCESPVWLARSDDTVRFRAWSETKILRGVLAILLEQANLLSDDSLAQFDFAQFLQACGLQRYLSQSRNNGIRHVVDRLRVL